MELIRASTILANVALIDTSSATEYLTSSLNGFNLEADKAISIVDKITYVDQKAATSSEELAIALQRSANSAGEAGIEIDKLLGIIATVSETTRKSASSIGESLEI